MALAHRSGVGGVRAIEFTDGLGVLQGLLNREVRVQIHLRGTFAGATMEGRLTRVHTLPPDHAAVDILLDDRQGLMLDPIDTMVLLVEDHSDGRRRIEFHLPTGVVATIEKI